MRLAGIWDHRPPEKVVAANIFPFLALSMSRLEVPLNNIPLFRLDAGVTSDKSIYPFPRVEIKDDYSELAELGLVQIVKKRRFSRERQVQVWLPRHVDTLKFHPPIIEAVGSFMKEVGADWDPASLEETGVNRDFVTYKSSVPAQELRMELGGPAQVVTATALAAAAMRLTVAETVAIHDHRQILEQYLKDHPEARLIRGGESEEPRGRT